METPLPRAAAVATVKAPIEVLKPWVAWHLNSGFDRMFLYFDDPDDPAIEEFSATGRVHATACTDDWWRTMAGGRNETVERRQEVNVNHGFGLAAAAGCAWAAHIDCDELVRPLAPLRDLLSSSTADALKLDMREAVSERMEYDSIFQPRRFKIVPNRLQRLAAQLLGCRRALRYGEYYRGHTASKMLVRLGGRVRRMGVHQPLEQDAGYRVEATAAIQLLHCDCVGFSDWDFKWRARLDGSRKFGGMRPARRKQLDAYRAASQNGVAAREALFRAAQMIPPYEAAVLRRIGLLETIDLDRAMFQLPGD